MKTGSILRAVCLLAAAACLTVGYLLIGDWAILLAIPALILFWLVAAKSSPFWGACGLLSIYIALAVLGITRHAPAVLLSAGCVLALMAWDLSDPRGHSADGKAGDYVGLMENRRLRSLAAVSIVSLLLVAVAALIRLELPFGVIVLLSLLLMGCLVYAIHYLRSSAFRPR